MLTTTYQRTAMAAAIAACFPGAALAAGVARVDFATGNVSATAPDGRSRPLAKGAEIQVGETVSTQAGRAQLRFADGAYMSLQPQTEFKVEEFKYSGRQEPSDNIVMNLIKGGMRTITGLIGRSNRNAYRLKTDVATIGIRGTEYSVRYTNSIEVHVTDGLVSVDNQSGSFTVAGGTTVQVNNQQTPPQTTDQKPVLPPETPLQEQEKVTEQLPPPPQPFQQAQQTLLTGTIEGNYAIIHNNYSVTNENATATLDPSGALTAFLDTSEGTISLGSAVAEFGGNDGVIAWGRWKNGTTSGVSIDTASAQHELHYVVGVAPTAMPTSGEATYSMIGATPPSGFEGVSVQSSSLKINFGTLQGQFNAAFTAGGQTLSTMPGGAGFSVSGGRFSSFGSACMVGNCISGSISFDGILAGAGASRAGLTYLLNVFGGSTHGAIAYKKN